MSYKNCPSGKDAVFSLEQGDGTYTISLCENISGTTYRVVTSKRVINETTFAGCVSPLTYSQQSDTLAVSAVA